MAEGLTTTSYAILGLLAVRPWTTSRLLAQQMDRALGRIWPRATSKLYEEPKLVAHGLAQTSTEHVGQRHRTIYTITANGRHALAAWVQHPGDGPVLEFEQLLKVFLAENATRQDTLATIAAAHEWARAR